MSLDYYSIELDHVRKIVRYTHCGKITDSEILSAWKAILRLEEFNKLAYNLLSNYQQAEFQIPLGKVHEIFKLLGENLDSLRNKKQALLLEQNHNLDLFTLTRQDLREIANFRIESFTRESAALTWLED